MISVVSEEIERFLNFVDESRSTHDMAIESMKREEKKLQDFLHAIEFEASAKERSKVCTKLHRSRNDRRRYKDIVEEREDLVKFFQDPQHKKTLEQLRQLLGRVRKVERYHADRTYIPRVKE
ncbi:MAG: hypothetical protein MRZ45_09280 [Blautia sp.]|nr:hypothetical protein [Blautia sp.]